MRLVSLMVLPVWMQSRDFLGVRVAVMQIVAIVGGDEGDAGFLGEPHEGLCLRAAQLQALVLNFEEKVAFAENVAEAIGVLAARDRIFSSTTGSVTGPRRQADSAMRPLLCFESRSRSMRGL